MVNVVDIIVPIVVGLITIAASIYLFAIYCHRTPTSTQPKRKPLATPPSSKY